ncbi:hypothetical protein F5880DRAFT_1509508, partial [Lentinula raphanica]
ADPTRSTSGRDDTSTLLELGIIQILKHRVVLPLHVETLVELELRPIWESYWQCKRLRNLSIKVNHCGPLDPDPHPGRSSVGSFYGDKNIPDQEDMNSVIYVFNRRIRTVVPTIQDGDVDEFQQDGS